MKLASSPAHAVVRPHDVAPATAISLLALASLLGCIAFGSAGAHSVAVLFLIVWVTVGLGSSLIPMSSKMGFLERSALGMWLGAAVVVTSSVIILRADIWHPRIVLLALSVLAALLHARVLLKNADEVSGTFSNASQFLTGLRREPIALASLCGLAICILFATLTPDRVDRLGGFTSSVNPAWFAAAGLVLVAAGVHYSGQSRYAWLPAFSAATAVTITPALIYSSPHSQSAYKHIAIIQYIFDNHTLSGVKGIYAAWPGFFSAVAAVCGAIGSTQRLYMVATYWPVFIAIASLLSFASLLRAAGKMSARSVLWPAVFLPVVANVVQQDYFSPQSLGYILALGVFSLSFQISCLHKGRWAFWQILSSPQTWWLLLIALAVTLAHQLSPFVAAASIISLVLWRVLRTWWLIAIVAIPPLLWSGSQRAVLRQFVGGKSVGSIDNFARTGVDAGSGLERSFLVPLSTLSGAIAVLVLGSLAAVTVFRNARSRWVWAYATAAASGFILILAVPYGNEGFYRAILFAIPWLGMLAADTILSVARAAFPWRMVAPVTMLALGGLLIASGSALDASNVIRRSDADAYSKITSVARADGSHQYLVVSLGPGDLPTLDGVQPRNLRFFSESLPLAAENLRQPPAEQVRYLASSAVQSVRAQYSSYLRLYLVWSPASLAYADEYGIWNSSKFRALRNVLVNEKNFRVFSASPEGTVMAQYIGKRL